MGGDERTRRLALYRAALRGQLESSGVGRSRDVPHIPNPSSRSINRSHVLPCLRDPVHLWKGCLQLQVRTLRRLVPGVCGVKKKENKHLPCASQQSSSSDLRAQLLASAPALEIAPRPRPAVLVVNNQSRGLRELLWHCRPQYLSQRHTCRALSCDARSVA